MIHLLRLSSETWAVWVGSVGTVLTLLLATLTYFFNSIANSKKLRKSQAEKITAWVISNNGEHAVICIWNKSDKPIYEVIVCLVAFQGAGDPTGITIPNDFKAFLSVSPPGKSYLALHGHSGMCFHPTAKVVFTDSNGLNWSREGNGRLNHIHQKPVEYFKLSRPLGWELPSGKMPTAKTYPPAPHPKTGKITF